MGRWLQDPEGKYEALQKFARDLTAAARDGQLDPVIGRDDEIRRAVQILSRRTKNNPVLIGEPGLFSQMPIACRVHNRFTPAQALWMLHEQITCSLACWALFRFPS